LESLDITSQPGDSLYAYGRHIHREKLQSETRYAAESNCGIAEDGSRGQLPAASRMDFNKYSDWIMGSTGADADAHAPGPYYRLR